MNFKYLLSLSVYVLLRQKVTLLGMDTPPDSPQKNQLEGRVVEGRYYGYKNSFSVEIPSFASPQHIEDDYFDNVLGGVAFYNDEGYFSKVEIDELLPEVKWIISKHPHIKNEVLDAMVNEAIIPQLKNETPDLKVLHQRSVTLENSEPALYMILNLPRAASLVEKSTGRNLDSIRGYLYVFSNNNQLVSFSMQDPYSLMPRFADSAKNHLNERLLNHLLQIQRTFKR